MHETRGESKFTRKSTSNSEWNSSATIKGHPLRHPFQQMTAVLPFHPTPIEI
ncbi:GD20568 [Drosophila simulans]|uniref:GD20568 n=1 Tax=Drosophila simulans TaxID=7240 RepID=B4QSB4_DROSI|nr:GD20568 [Drosophila simulans]